MAKVRLTLTGSYIGLSPKQRGTLRSLGLSKREQSVELEFSDWVKGALRKVGHVVDVTELEEE